MPTPKFKIGDVVYLNSEKNNHHKFTVSVIGTEPIPTMPGSTQFNGFYTCIWLDNDAKLNHYDFNEGVLSPLP